jgi:hypothetical protein
VTVDDYSPHVPFAAASSGVGIPEKTTSLSSNTRKGTILNDFVICVVASITNQSRNRPRHSASSAVASPPAAWRQCTNPRDNLGPG